MAGIPTGLPNPAEVFITLDVWNALFLVLLGFLGGTLSGFIGSGGAFVLTPGMMSIGAPGAVAVASNMCHKFPKAMVGSWKRKKIGHLDVKLAAVMAITAIIGVQVGIVVQRHIAEMLGPAGTSLYVSMAFLIVLPIVAATLIRDVLKAKKGGLEDTEPRFAKKLQKINIPPMMEFKVAKSRISAWFTIPLGFGTGFLAATIAVGGFIGVPSMIYIIGASSAVASGTELGIAFVMGLTGTFTWATLGMVDFRMTALILFGSLFGVQLGAVGTTYVKQYMIKAVMAAVMLMVTISRALAIPKYLSQLHWISLSESTITILSQASFLCLFGAIIAAGVLILVPMFRTRSRLIKSGELEGSSLKGKSIGKTAIFGMISLTSYALLFIYADAWTEFATGKTILSAVGVILIAIYFSIVHGTFADGILKILNIDALKKPAGVPEPAKVPVDTAAPH